MKSNFKSGVLKGAKLNFFITEAYSITLIVMAIFKHPFNAYYDYFHLSEVSLKNNSIEK